MAAGQGFKTFTTGEVLTAGDVNGYLMQGINVFTNATARDAAITAPAEGQFAFTKDNNSLWYYDGAAWVASGATGDIEGVTATSPLTGGGTSGTVTVGIQSASTTQLGAVQLSDSTASTSTTLAATANAVKTTYDLANGAIPKSLIDAAGDLIVGTAADTAGRIAIGTNGQVLTSNGTTATWSTPGGASGPTFKAYKSTNQTVTKNTFTKITFDTENWDTAGNFASSTFTPTTAGYYQFNVETEISGSGTLNSSFITIYKNGSRAGDLYAGAVSVNSGSDLFYANGSTDYFEVYGQCDYASGGESFSGDAGGYRTRFSGVWIRS